MRSDSLAPGLVTALTACAVVAGSLASAQSGMSERLLEVLRLRGESAYRLALRDAKQLASEHPDLDTVHRALVDLFLLLHDVSGARSYFEERVETDPRDAYAHYGLGRLDFHEGDVDGALEKLKRAVSLEPEFAEPYGVHGGLVEVYRAKDALDAAIDYFGALTIAYPRNANALLGLGWSYAQSFQVDEAIRSFTRALELNPDLTQANHGLVQSYFRTGRYQKSWESCLALRQAADRRGDFEMLAYAAMMQGTIAWFRGDYLKALDYLHESLNLAKEIGDRSREASSVNNAAAVYAMAGDHEKALEYFRTNLRLARDSGDIRAELIALGNVGSVHKEARRYESALAHYREALMLAREYGFRTEQCVTLANMAEAFQGRGDLAEALRYYNAEAIAYYNRALSIGERTGEVQAVWEAQAGLGSTYKMQGEAAKAIAHYAEAIALYDEVREGLAIESLGSSFLEDKYEAYPAIVQLLAAEGAFKEAFAFTEKFKAKGFLDILARGQTLFETHLPEDLRLELEAVRAELSENHAELSRMRSRILGNVATAVTLEERITALELRKSLLLDRVREENGEFYEMALSEPLDVASVQSRVLEPDQVLVEYLIGEESLSVFVVSRDELHYREVPVGRQELRRRLAKLSPLFEVDGALDAKSSGQVFRVFNPELADFSLPPARALYQTLLEPVEAWLPESAELIIVPDDFLFYLPFEVLVIESRDAEHRYDFSAATFLVERYAVSYSASASVLDPTLKRPRESRKGVIAFGNPSFPDTMDRTPRLPNSEAEVEAIQAAFEGFENSVFTGDAATETAFEQEAEQYGVLHFATHFWNDDRQPLYSRIALADGVLQTYEIFDAKLNAELAVLSACNTGLGNLRKGEGLIGISRAFLYAGVPSLVVSLWSVDDDATARIMEFFYRHLQAGSSKKQALRQAKLDYLHASRGDKKDPFYWAPFILNGDWRPLALPKKRRPERDWLVPVSGFLLLSAAIGFMWKRRGSRSLAT